MQNIPAKRRKSGFTLIELLVVIAIIAILAAILFPVFARARENARRASCQSNEKNIALGFKQYIQDNGEKYPPTIDGAMALQNSAATGGALSEYIKSTAIFICPSDALKTGSYGYKLTGAPNESSIEKTAETVLLNESGRRHFDGQNLAYVDGHVKWTKGGGITLPGGEGSLTSSGALPPNGITVTVAPGTGSFDGNCTMAAPCEVKSSGSYTLTATVNWNGTSPPNYPTTSDRTYFAFFRTQGSNNASGGTEAAGSYTGYSFTDTPGTGPKTGTAVWTGTDAYVAGQANLKDVTFVMDPSSLYTRTYWIKLVP